MADEKKKMQDIFKKNIPDSLKNNELIDQYAEAIGEIFEEMRVDINYKASETDYAKSRYATFPQVISNFGLNLSPKLRENITRRIIRDAQDIFTRLGTRDGLKWALKTVGYRRFDIDEVWIPNPDLIRKGYFRNLNEVIDPIRYDLSKRSYTDFVVGKEYVTATGTFFEGYFYDDFEKVSPVSNVPIYGETYSTYTGLTFKDMVAKTPYIVVRLYDPPDFDEIISDVDPKTGDPIFVSLPEKQRIINITIRYLIQELQRTATTKIILVTDLLIFDDPVPRMEDPLAFTTTHTPFDYIDVMNSVDDLISFVSTATHQNMADSIDTVDDTLSLTFGPTVPQSFSDTINTVQETLVNDGRIQLTTVFDPLEIGNKRKIGQDHPYPATGEYISKGKIGVVGTTERDILESTRGVAVTYDVVNPVLNYEHVLFLDYGATVSFTTPAGISVDVETMKNYHASTFRTAVTTVSGGTAYSQSFTDAHAVILRFSASYTGRMQVSVTY